MITMVELNVASVEEIRNELKRRELVEHNNKITKLLHEIDYAHQSGRIINIIRDVESKGTSLEVIKYHVFMK